MGKKVTESRKMREILKHFMYGFLGVFLALTVQVHAQSQSGFISLDCGIPENSSYTDKNTGLNYVSDSSFTAESSTSNTISTKYLTSIGENNLEQQFQYLRSFPNGDKNCYTLKPQFGRGSKYLIRARFLYGNYDGKNSAPGFNLYIGGNKWGPVKLENASSVTTMEMIYIPVWDYVFVCLVNTGHGIPFISALELRPLKNSTYAPTRAAALYRRMDVGSRTNGTVRYKDDIYDRIWEPFNFLNRKVLSTNLLLDADAQYPYQPPSTVMSTAMSPAEDSTETFFFYIKPENPDAMYFVHMHFAELQKLNSNQSREFEIFENGEHFNGPISPDYLYSTTISSLAPVRGDVRIDYEINKTSASNLPPILNALEVYIIQNFSAPDTHQQDVEAMMKIKSQYGVKKENWQGDPCAPVNYMWEGLNCSFNSEDQALRIISLDLSSSGLTGEISPDISDLTMIKFLDLSNNGLIGSLPNFLSKLKFLKLLDLRGNNLTGSVPEDLIERSNSGSLSLRVSGNQNLCSSLSCQNSSKNKKMNNVIPIVASIAVVLVLLIALFIGLKLMKRRKQASKDIDARKIGPKNSEFTYSEISAMTNNFEKVIGKGGFGAVFLGCLNDTQVAVKMLSATSGQGYKEFEFEVKLLMRVHHRNLTSLIGYCYQNDHIGLVYEFMANGNLATHLSEKSSYTLTWEERMRIAVDAAQGLEYLHHGCKPPIIHRDVKPANILLNEKFQAKIADFGLSRDFQMENATHVSTVVAGTIGYLDLECIGTNRLTEKSDVYSFGVVLLQIITSRATIMKMSNDENLHVSAWVDSMVAKGEIKGIVDSRLEGDFDTNSAWKAVETATACLKSSRERPTMNQVVIDLKECLALETSSSNNRGGRPRTPTSIYSPVTLEDHSLIPVTR